jgi:hypothetical protein
MFRIQPRSHGGAFALWEDVQALAALNASPGTPSNRTRAQGSPTVSRRGALRCQ